MHVNAFARRIKLITKNHRCNYFLEISIKWGTTGVFALISEWIQIWILHFKCEDEFQYVTSYIRSRWNKWIVTRHIEILLAVELPRKLLLFSMFGCDQKINGHEIDQKLPFGRHWLHVPCAGKKLDIIYGCTGKQNIFHIANNTLD